MTFPVAPDHRDEALDRIETLAEHAREEDGVVNYRIAAVEDPNLFRFFERYEDEAAFGARVESDHLREFEAAPPISSPASPK